MKTKKKLEFMLAKAVRDCNVFGEPRGSGRLGVVSAGETVRIYELRSFPPGEQVVWCRHDAGWSLFSIGGLNYFALLEEQPPEAEAKAEG